MARKNKTKYSYSSFKDTAVTQKQLSKVKVPKSITSGKSGLYSDLYREYKVLAKRADHRLSELEKLSGKEGFENVTKWSYGRAMRDIKAWSGEGRTRFNTKAPESTQGLKAKLEDIKTFLESATSTKTKIVTSFQNRANKINEKYGTDFTWEDMGKFFESELWTRMNNDVYGSKTLVRAIGQAKNDIKPDDIPKSTQQSINEIVAKYGAKIEQFFHE